MYLFGQDISMNEVNKCGAGGSIMATIIPRGTYDIEAEIDEEWSTPLAKISRLYYDHESWTYAKEILETPSAACRKVGDEARSIVARHIIDRIREKQYIDKIHSVAPRLRSAVELLSKPDADYVYPPFRFVVNQLLEKHPEVYTSVVQNVDLRIPVDMKPTTMLVTMAKYVLEDTHGNIDINWGKFTSLLCLSGALAIDSIEAGYPEGLVHVVDTFGLIVEQVMGEWILSKNGGNGWVGFIKLNQYQPIVPPIPRTIIILAIIAILLYLISHIVIFIIAKSLEFFYLSANTSQTAAFWRRWGNVFSSSTCALEFQYPNRNRLVSLVDNNETISSYYYLYREPVCPTPTNIMDAIFSNYIYG